MTKKLLLALAALALPLASARAGLFIGVGVPGPYYRPYYRPYYYGPRFYVAPPPVVIYGAPAPAPVVVQQAPTVYVPAAQAPPSAEQGPAPRQAPKSYPSLPPEPLPVRQ